ncbi:MAG TPA: serine hydrolase domain-containing protein [Chloroflexaceae bacterium]|nr:serine hydrolase domain-containing protein [Chloroflexaceae bacterium]
MNRTPKPLTALLLAKLARSAIALGTIGALLVGLSRPALATPSPAAPAPTSHPAGPSNPDELTAFLDTFVPAQLEREHIVGAAVAVVKDGELLAARGYGYADLERRTPVIADQTLFATGSSGKLFTWAAVLQQVEQGRLDLDADVNTYLGDLEPRVPATFPERVTLRHLLSHTAGFDNLPGIFARRPEELVSAELYMAGHMPARVRPPGELTAYSNYGTSLAGVLVKEITHTPIERYLEQELFAPLQMQSTTLRQPLPAELAARAATGYTYAGGAFRVAPTYYVRIPAAGASYSTVTDMARFLSALLQDGRLGEARIFGEATGRQMRQQLFTHDPLVSGMAYGLAEAMLNGQRVLKHNGVIPTSFNSIIALFPEHGVGLYASYNSNGTFAHGEHLLQAFVDHYYPAEPVAPAMLPEARQAAAGMAGTYRASNAFAASFAKLTALIPGSGYDDIRLIAAPDGSVTTVGLGPEPLRWVPVAPDVLRLADGRLDSYGDLVFHRDVAGRPARLFIQNNPFRAYERVPWYETGGFSLGLLGACSVVFLSAALGWPIGALFRRRAVTPAAARAVSWMAGGAAALALLFLPATLLTVPEAISFGATPGLRAALALPVLSAALLAGSALVALRAWPRLSWGRVRRGHYLLVVLAGLAYLWLLQTWNLLGLPL